MAEFHFLTVPQENRLRPENAIPGFYADFDFIGNRTSRGVRGFMPMCPYPDWRYSGNQQFPV